MRVAICLMVLTMATLLAGGIVVAASENVPKNQCSVSDIEKAMIRLKQPYVDDPVIADSAYRREIATAILSAATESGNPPLFLTGLFYRESSFRRAVLDGRRLGTRREYGLGQVNGVAKFWCLRSGYNLKTIDGQARCSAGWLTNCRKTCDGSLEQGFARYATGRSCSPRFAGDTHKDRFAVWKALEDGTPIPKPPRQR